MNSKQKGNRGERELAAKLRELGCTGARRSQQFCGDAGDEDVKCDSLPRWFIECKRVEQLNLHDAVEKAAIQTTCGKIPVVIHRKNGKKWLATFQLEDAVLEELNYLERKKA